VKRRLTAKNVIGWILLLFGISGVSSVLQSWGAADTDYERHALTLEAFVVVALLLWGVRLVRSRPKADAAARGEGDDPAAGETTTDSPVDPPRRLP
jgi:uncharacterized membrane protein